METVQSTELLRLQEKVKALERQNAILKQSKTGDNIDGAEARAENPKRLSIISTGDEDDIKLLEIEDLDGSEDNWLFDLSAGEQAGEEESDWLRADVTSPTSAVALKKKSLVNKLDDIARRSPSHSAHRYGGQLNGSFSSSSPYKSLTTSPPSSKYGPPVRGSQFDPRTFTRGQAGGKSGVGAYSLPPDDEEPKVRKPSYHRLNFGAKNQEENILNTTYEKEEEGNLTFDKANTTFSRTSDNLTDNLYDFNTTYDRNMSSNKDALNSTFTRNGTPSNQGCNTTFNRSSADPGTLNATFEGPVNGCANHRKMSEDRISSASSSCDVSNRLSRESSQDILVEDLDRLSTTSAMSESSVSHRLNDVQDVQDIARMQEESLKHSTPLKQRSDTISPLSEHSLSSPVEEGGGYQSEESCGSESGVVRPGPRRGETQPRCGVYSSQDSLPDSPYSSQSLDSHASQGGPEVRRSMPNLNKLRGGKAGPGSAPPSQYGLSQAKYHNSESRLQNPPVYRAAPGGRSLRPPASSGLLRPGTVSGLRPPGERKLSGIARPQGLPRPTSRLQQPGSYMRSGRGGSALGRVSGQRTDNKNWLEDCY